jgi:branched-chain amino acid transport system permease protein
MKLGRNWRWLLLVVAFFLVPFLIHSNPYYLSVFTLCMINVLMTTSLRTIAITGQMCVGIMAFMGTGAYTSALLMMKLGLPIWVTLPMSGLTAMVLASIIAYPSVRVTGMYFGMITLFFNQVVLLVLNQWSSLTGGSTGLLNIPSVGHLAFLGLNVDFGRQLPYAYFVLVIVAICAFFLYRIDHSHLGTTFATIEQDESAARNVGINVTWVKVYAFCTGCFFAGVSGCLYTHYLRVINPDVFGLFPSIYIMIYMVAGGRKTFIGPIIGAIILTLIPQIFSSLTKYQPFLYVGALYIVLYLMPGGIADLPNIIRAQFYKLRERRAAP